MVTELQNFSIESAKAMVSFNINKSCILELLLLPVFIKLFKIEIKTWL